MTHALCWYDNNLASRADLFDQNRNADFGWSSVVRGWKVIERVLLWRVTTHVPERYSYLIGLLWITEVQDRWARFLSSHPTRSCHFITCGSAPRHGAIVCRGTAGWGDRSTYGNHTPHSVHFDLLAYNQLKIQTLYWGIPTGWQHETRNSWIGKLPWSNPHSLAKCLQTYDLLHILACHTRWLAVHDFFWVSYDTATQLTCSIRIWMKNCRFQSWKHLKP